MAGTTTRSIDYNALLTSAREKYHKEGVPQDNIFEAIPTLEALRGKGSFKTEADGGEVIRIDVIKEQNSGGGSYRGYEPSGLTPQDEFTAAFEQWRQYHWDTPISGIEIFKNGGAQKIFDLLAQKESVTHNSATEDINRDLWDLTGISSGSMGNGGKNINSIPLLVGAATANYNIHGINPTSEGYWDNRRKDAGGSTLAGNKYIAMIRHLLNTANRGRGAGRADLLIFDQISHENFIEALDTKVRYMSTDAASPGFNKVDFGGVECIWDVYVPDPETPGNGGPDVTLAKGAIYALNSKCTKFYVGKGKDFAPTPFVDGYYNGQDAKVSLTLLYAQLVCDSLRNNAVLYNVPLAIS